MKVHSIADLERLPYVGPVLAGLLTALGVTDDDLPDIVPEPPQFTSDEEAAAWVKAHLPAVAAKVARLEGDQS